MEAIKNYNNAYLKVYPKGAGNFGYMSISGIKYKGDSHLREMEENIKRHVDNVGSVEIAFDEDYDEWMCSKCETTWATEKEAEDCCKKPNNPTTPGKQGWGKMRIITIQEKNDISTGDYKYSIKILGIRFNRVLTQEEIVLEKYPFWFKFSRWLLEVMCRHEWEKDGTPELDGYFLGDRVHFFQEVKCKKCGKKDKYRYEDKSLDTSW